MSILSVDTIQPIGSGSTVTLNAAKIVVGTGITFESNGQAIYAGIITATSFSGSGANLTSLPAQATIANNADNRVITGGSGVNLNGESNLTFDGSTLNVSGKITNSASYTSHNANFYGGDVNTGGVRIEVAHSTTSVSGNTASASFPHHLLLSNYSGTGSADNRMCSIGFDIPTTSTHANAVIAYQATAAGTGDLQFHLESGNSISEKLRITSSGDVGIGITNPTKTGIQNLVKVLQIDGGDGAELILGNSVSSNVSTNHIGAIAFKNIDTSTGNAPHYAGIRCNTTDTSGNMNLKFYTGSTNFESDTPQVSIDSGGSFTALGNKPSANAQMLQNTSSTNPEGLYIRFPNASPNTSARHALKFSDSVGDKAVIDSNGNSRNLNNSYGGFSDISLKENIVDAGSQWDDIKNIKVRVFNFKTDSASDKRIGVVAQEIETVCPKLVGITNDKDVDGNLLETGVKSVKYSVLYMKAIKALQEAQARIETLEAKVTTLEGS